MNTWVEICTMDDLQPDSGVCALAADKQVALFYMARTGQVYAVDNYDPIGKANILSRGMIGDLGGEPMVASPMYKQHFNLKTGVCIENADIKIDVYPVRIDRERVSICIEGES